MNYIIYRKLLPTRRMEFVQIYNGDDAGALSLINSLTSTNQIPYRAEFVDSNGEYNVVDNTISPTIE